MPTIATLKPLAAKEFDYWKAQHLLNRAGFGGTPGQVRALANMGLDGAVDFIVDYDDQPDDAVTPDLFDADIMRPLTDAERQTRRIARRDGDEAVLEQVRRERQERQGNDRRQMRDIQRWWLKRIIESSRPLEEKMTLFWHGHFATGYRTIEDSYHMFLQNQMFRANATGRFHDLARGVIHDPAMLRYLNNNQNRKQKPNENLARELMELFTLGEGNAYSEDDIKQGARALTGYTYDDDVFAFRARMHDGGTKRILGATGEFDGDDFVEIILKGKRSRRTCSEFITLKLYRYFVNDLPDGADAGTEAYVKKLAARFLNDDHDVRALLRTMFRSAHFYDAGNVAAKIKSPTQLIAQTMRTLRTPARNLGVLADASDLMGQQLFYPPSVKGWPVGRPWINTATLFVRQNTLVYMLTGRRPDAKPWESDGVDFDATHLVAELAETTGEVDAEAGARYLLRFMLGTEPHPARVRTIVDFVAAHGGKLDRNDVVVGTLSLIAAMPEYQLC